MKNFVRRENCDSKSEFQEEFFRFLMDKLVPWSKCLIFQIPPDQSNLPGLEPLVTLIICKSFWMARQILPNCVDQIIDDVQKFIEAQVQAPIPHFKVVSASRWDKRFLLDKIDEIQSTPLSSTGQEMPFSCYKHVTRFKV